MRRHQALNVPAAVAIQPQRSAAHHHFQHAQQLLGDLQIVLITRMVKRDQDLVGQTPAMVLRPER